MIGSNESERVCVIGVGNMGGALAEALIAKDYRVTVWNRTTSKCDALAAAGASVAASVSEAASRASFCVIGHMTNASCISPLDDATYMTPLTAPMNIIVLVST